MRGPDGIERRVGRRSDVLGALTDLLDAVRRDGELEALALADVSGVLVAGAGAFERCEELAAMAPILSRARVANDTIPTRLDVIARRMEVRRLSIDGIEVLLSASAPAGEALRRAAQGCARILGRSRVERS